MWLPHTTLLHAAICPDPAQAEDRNVQWLERYNKYNLFDVC